ncbi:MAG: metallophosphoesterase, partial [Desulfobaccales bacterium]
MAADIYAIGDIHGNLDLLQRLLEKIQPDLARDQLVFMGDYIDRGP